MKIKGIGYILLAILAGVILLILPAESGEDTANNQPVYKSANEYCLELEAKTEELIKELGVKNCKVQITLVYGYEYAYAADQRVNQKNDSTGSVAEKEIEKKYVVITSNKGSETVLLREKMPTVQGIAVVCKGASYEMQYKIISLLTALYDIPSNRISVQT